MTEPTLEDLGLIWTWVLLRQRQLFMMTGTVEKTKVGVLCLIQQGLI